MSKSTSARKRSIHAGTIVPLTKRRSRSVCSCENGAGFENHFQIQAVHGGAEFPVGQVANVFQLIQRGRKLFPGARELRPDFDVEVFAEVPVALLEGPAGGKKPDVEQGDQVLGDIAAKLLVVLERDGQNVAVIQILELPVAEEDVVLFGFAAVGQALRPTV